MQSSCQPGLPMRGRGLVASPRPAALHHHVDLRERGPPWLLHAPHTCNQVQPELALN